MSYTTDLPTLLILSDDEWDALLASVWNAPVPREIVRLDPKLLPRKPGNRMGRPKGVKNKTHRPDPRKLASESRRAAIVERRRIVLLRSQSGDKGCDIARELGISTSMVSRILTGERN